MSDVETRSRAADMLARKGQTVTLTYVGTSSYDPTTGVTTPTAPDPEQVKGALFPLSIAIRYGFKQAGSLIVEGDQKLLLSAQNIAGSAITAPQVNGSITDASGNIWTIIALEPLNPAGTAILFDCVVRRAG